MRAVVIMAMKDLRLLWSDKFAVFWVFAFPLMYALFFGAIFGGVGGGGGGAGISLIVVDEDGSSGAAALVEELSASDALRVRTSFDGGEDEPAQPFDAERARDAVRRGDAVAYLRIPEGYAGDPFTMFDPSTPALEVGIDPSRKAEAGYLQGLVTQAAFQRMRGLFSDPAAFAPDLDDVIADIRADPSIDPVQRGVLTTFMGSLRTFMADVEPLGGGGGEEEDGDGGGFNPVRIEVEQVVREGVGPPTAFAVSFPQAMAWGLIGCSAGFAISLVQERTRGTYARLLTGPVSRSQVLAGKGLSCFIACCAALVVLVAFGAVFGVRPSSWVGLAAAIAAGAACFTGIMMLISTLGRTEQAVAGAGWAALMPLAMLGGGMVPLMFMPGWMATLGNVSPVKWMIVAMEQATWRGGGLGDLLPPLAVLLGVGALGLAGGSVVLSRRSA